MLRFNLLGKKDYRELLEFQYILCYGSTSENLPPISGLLDFNTSYVTVQLCLF